MNNIRSFFLRKPKRLVIASLIVSVFLDFIPFDASWSFWLPECTVLLLLYWTLHRPQDVGLGTAFLMGLIIDIGTGSPFGQHALSYIFAVFFIQQQRRFVLSYTYGFQCVVLAGALLINTITTTLIHFFEAHYFIGWSAFVSPFTGALLWPLLNKFMLFISNHQSD